MGHIKESVQALIEGEASESEEFGCPYCSESYESREKRDRCQASHFENTESIDKGKGRRSRTSKNIVEEWRRGEEVEEC